MIISMHTLISSAVLASMLGAGVAVGATVTGKINGHNCAHHGHSCPVSKNDPHLALEPDFVLQKPDGDYYFMTNLPRDTKARYALQNVTVSGEIDEKHSNIDVDEFKVDGEIVWSKMMQREAREKMYGGEGWAVERW